MAGLDEQLAAEREGLRAVADEMRSPKPGPNDRLREIEEALKAKEAEERSVVNAPLLRLVVRDDLGRAGKRVEVYDGGMLVGQLPAVSVEYEMNVVGVSVLKVGVHVADAVMQGGDFR